jgi:pimeloyl-ACP methyl ester carboxylesterase
MSADGAMNQRLLYVPGGPGFSAAYEALELAAPLAGAGYDATFWRQPWRYGDAPSLAGELGALERELRALGAAGTTLVCHGAAVHHALLLLAKGVCPGRLVLIAPALDQRDVHRRLLNFAAEDLVRQGRRDDAFRIRNLMADSTAWFDAPAQEALVLATRDPDLFQHSWHDRRAYHRFARTAAPPNEFRTEAFLAVGADLAGRAVNGATPPTRHAITASAVFGERDPLVDITGALLALRRVFATVEPMVIAHAGHWPHCERPGEFARLLRPVSSNQ